MSRLNISVPYENTYWVVPGQFLAGEHPNEFEEADTIARLSAHLDAGIRTFIDLTEEKEMKSYHGLLRSLAEERRIDITFLRIPIRDRGVPPIWTVSCILNVIDHSVRDKRPVFVHCFAGIGRTGTVVGCYLKRHGMTTKPDVIMKIVELRRLMPSGREASPHTPEQVRMVEEWKEGA